MKTKKIAAQKKRKGHGIKREVARLKARVNDLEYAKPGNTPLSLRYSQEEQERIDAKLGYLVKEINAPITDCRNIEGRVRNLERPRWK